MGISVTDQSVTQKVDCIVMGGTFDPIHNGHIRSAHQLAETLHYQHINLMPCGDAYHKQDVSSVVHRVAMLKLALKDEPLLRLDERETHREGATFTVDTLQELRNELGDHAHICWVLGTDAALGLTKWHQWQKVFQLANVIVMHRAGEPSADAELKQWPAHICEDAADFKKRSCGGVMHVTLTPYEVSSTAIRQNLQQNQSVAHHVPQAVLNYIEQHGLYRGNH